MPAMIPKLVEKDLLYVLCYMRGSARKNKGSASHDPQASRKGSAVCIVLHEGVCQKEKGSASHDPQVSSKGSALCIVLHERVLPGRQGFCQL